MLRSIGPLLQTGSLLCIENPVFILAFGQFSLYVGHLSLLEINLLIPVEAPWILINCVDASIREMEMPAVGLLNP